MGTADKWIDLFLTKISTQKDEENRAKKEKRRQGRALKAQEKAEVLNRILSSDPNYGLYTQHNERYRDTQGADRKLLVSSKEPTDLIVSPQSTLKRPRMNKRTHNV